MFHATRCHRSWLPVALSKSVSQPCLTLLIFSTLQTVQELAARIIKDGERPDIDPKAIVLWVGTNNVKQPNAKNANPADKLDWCALKII